MKYRDLNIQTQREAPNNARTEGFSFLVRAGYLTRENNPTQLGEATFAHLQKLSNHPAILKTLALPVIGNEEETFVPIGLRSDRGGPLPPLPVHRTTRAGRVQESSFFHRR